MKIESVSSLFYGNHRELVPIFVVDYVIEMSYVLINMIQEKYTHCCDKTCPYRYRVFAIDYKMD